MAIVRAIIRMMVAPPVYEILSWQFEEEAAAGFANSDIFDEGGPSTAYADTIDEGGPSTTYTDAFDEGAP